MWDEADAPVTKKAKQDECPDQRDTLPSAIPSLGTCEGEHPIAIRYAYSHDHGGTWSRPIDITRPGVSVFWPWVVAGRDGTIGVVWYQSDRRAAVDIEASNIYVYGARLGNADGPTPDIQIAPATGTGPNGQPRPSHYGTVCQTGAGCLNLPSSDRRLGDYLTATLDQDGRMVIAYADTSNYPNSPLSRPALVRQTAGPPLD